MYLFIYLFSRYRLQIFIHNVTKLIIREFRNESKTKRRSEKKKKNANDSAMYRNFCVNVKSRHPLASIFPIFTNVRINWQSGFLAVDRRCIRAASSRTGFLLKHEARSTASVMRSFHRVTYRLAHHSWFSISRQKRWPAFSKKTRFLPSNRD